MSTVAHRINNSLEFDLTDEEINSFEFFLTTSDNFFDPFEDFSSWFAFDSLKNYNSSGLLDRIVVVPQNLGEHLERREVVRAMHSIVRLNASGMHKIVVRERTQGM